MKLFHYLDPGLLRCSEWLLSVNSYNRWQKLDGTKSHVSSVFPNRKSTEENASAEENGLRMNEIMFTWGDFFPFEVSMFLSGAFCAWELCKPNDFISFKNQGCSLQDRHFPITPGQLRRRGTHSGWMRHPLQRDEKRKGKKQQHRTIPAIASHAPQRPVRFWETLRFFGQSKVTLRTSAGRVDSLPITYTNIWGETH